MTSGINAPLTSPHPTPPHPAQAKISGANTTTAEGILADAAKQSPIPLVTFIVYDLPNRVCGATWPIRMQTANVGRALVSLQDCHAKASNGEICCACMPTLVVAVPACCALHAHPPASRCRRAEPRRDVRLRQCRRWHVLGGAPGESWRGCHSAVCTVARSAWGERLAHTGRESTVERSAWGERTGVPPLHCPGPVQLPLPSPQDYESNYVTPLATVFGKYPQVPIVAIIEPDSLPNRECVVAGILLMRRAR